MYLKNSDLCAVIFRIKVKLKLIFPFLDRSISTKKKAIVWEQEDIFCVNLLLEFKLMLKVKQLLNFRDTYA